MLPKNYNLVDINKTNINLCNKISCIDIKIDNDSCFEIDDNNLKLIQKVNKINFKLLFKEYQSLLEQLNLIDEDINWLYLIGQENYGKYVKNFKAMLLSLNELKISSYFFNILPVRYKLTNLISKFDNQSTISKYSHINTITGRMTIESGFNFLTMSKDKKSTLVPKNSDYVLVEIDIKSCEPVLLHNILYKYKIDDIYQYFINLTNKKFNRKNIKLGIISTLYGASQAKAKKIANIDKVTLDTIYSHFKLEPIKKYLKDFYNKNGKIYNLYGRPIYENGCLINYWLQSTAADYACLAFYDLIIKHKLNLKAVIHDAIIVEVHKSNLKKIKEIKNITDPITNITLEVDNRLIKE
jgi:hypothetical protein